MLRNGKDPIDGFHHQCAAYCAPCGDSNQKYLGRKEKSFNTRL